MATSSRVKVKTDKLIEAVRARRAQVVKDHDSSVAAYAASEKSIRAQVQKDLKTALESLKSSELPKINSNYRQGNYIEVPTTAERIAEPRDIAYELAKIDRLLKTLEMASDETQTISADDAAQYLG